MSDILRWLLFLPEPASRTARDIDLLHFFVISVTFLGSLAVFAAALSFVIRYRRKRPDQVGRTVPSPRGFEVATALGLLTLFVLWWVIGFRQYVHMQRSPREALEVHVVAKQWMWKFEQADGDVTVGLLVVPAQRDVRLLLTSRDVVHSFYVPMLRVKQDAVPGMTTALPFRTERPGIFPAYCAEYCGLSHSRMWASVVALPPDEWERWKGGEMPPMVARAVANAGLKEPVRLRAETKLADRGRAAAARHGCFGCHTENGQPHIGPSWASLYRKRVQLSDGSSVIADENYMTRSMMDPMAEIVAGFRPVMPTYQGQLSQPEAAAIVAYIKTLKDVPRRSDALIAPDGDSGATPLPSADASADGPRQSEAAVQAAASQEQP